MVNAKRWILAHHFDGVPKDSDLELVEEALPALKEGDVLLQAVYLSVDPYMRPYSARVLKEGDTMIGSQVALVTESKNPKFPKGSYVVANVGWRSHTVTADETLLRPLPSGDKKYLSYALGAFGVPGMSAYFGLLEICKPTKGEVVLVTGAAGAVGSIVGQIAKIKGCKVIAFAGTDEKCSWLREQLKFDFVYNYNTIDEEKAIREAAPEGVDCFFDNVGGKSYIAGLRCMKPFGRVSLCGAISRYNAQEEQTVPDVNFLIIKNQLKVEGFIVLRWLPKWGSAIQEMIKWIEKGKLQVRETIVEGFENTRSAFYGLFKGDNIGKAVVKA